MADDGTTMRLRYAGVCAGCDQPVAAGERAHYLRAARAVRCLACGLHAPDDPAPAPTATPALGTRGGGGDAVFADEAAQAEAAELVQGPLPRTGGCGDCGRRVARGSDALFNRALSAVLCMDCVTLDTVHSLGVPGGGARREHAKRQQRHHTTVRTTHPRLGGLILALREDPAHVRAWHTGAVGEEEFGRRLSGVASDALKVLHDRKLPRSAANIDHLAVTSEGVWVLDAKRYKGKVETRGSGLLSRRPPELYVGGRNQTKLVEGVKGQVGVVEAILSSFADEHGIEPVPVRGALVFIDAEFGLLASPLSADGVWIGWGRAVRKRLTGAGSDGPVPVTDVAKRLARELRAG